MGVARHCKRCGHNWEQRTLQVDSSEQPVQCPKCKSPKWNTERTLPRGAKPKPPIAKPTAKRELPPVSVAV